MKKYIIAIVVSFILIISFILGFSFKAESDEILLLEDGLGLYPNISEKIDNVNIQESLAEDTKALAIECNEYTARQLLKTNKSYKFNPIYSANVKIVINKELTDKKVESFTDILNSNLDINVTLDNKNSVYLLMAISKLYYNSESIEDAFKYLKILNNNKHLISEAKNANKAQVRIMLDKDIKDNPNLEIITPKEGLIYYNFGILENRESNIDMNIFKELKDELGYSDINSGNIHIDTDSVYDDFIVDRIELYRREILGTYKISGVNSDERSIILLVSMMILIPWAIFMVIRVNDKTIQKGLIITITLLITWLIFRYYKAETASPTLLRYIWYFNYVVLTFCPAFWLIMNIYLHYRNKMAKRLSTIIWVIAAILSFLVLTNDLHNWAFKFPRGATYFEDRSFGFIFYLICALDFILIFAGTILLIKKNYKSRKLSTLLGPIIVSFLILIYIALDFTSLKIMGELDYNLVVTILAFLLIETSLRAGLIQNCGKYVSLFNNLSFEASITDLDNNHIYSTKEYNTDIILKEDELLLNDSKYRKLKMNNGYLVYKDDLTEIYKLQNELNDITNELKRNNEALKNKENYTKDYYKLLNESNILNELDSELKLRKNEIDLLVNQIDENLELSEIKLKLARIKVLVSYIKQRYNLYLNSKLNKYMEIQNIALSIKLISTDVKSLGINSGLLCNSMEMIPSELCVIILDIFFFMLENAYNSKTDLFTNINVESGYIVIFGLFDDIDINNELLIDKLKELISNNKISMEISKTDDMKKVLFRIGSDLVC